ncbi:HAD family hydrolase [Thermaerobacter litoralis]
MVIFDLDGTLYDDLLYSTAYARVLAAHLPGDLRGAFLRETFPFSDVNRRLRMGRIYDRIEDVLHGHPQLEPGVAVRWEGGSPAPWRRVTNTGGYIGAPGRYLGLGDVWMLVTATALRFGLSPDECLEAMVEVRSWVTVPPPESYREEPFFTAPGEPLRVLVTNAATGHAETILKFLGLDGAFSHCFTEAGKPEGWRRIIPLLEQVTGIPRQQMLAVGDNLLNDVLPVRELGVQAVLVDRYGLYPQHFARDWVIIRSLDTLFPALLPKTWHRLVPS